jgi:hypothetical protein
VKDRVKEIGESRGEKGEGEKREGEDRDRLRSNERVKMRQHESEKRQCQRN